MKRVVSALVVLSVALACAASTAQAQPGVKAPGDLGSRLAQEQAREQAREQAETAEKLALAKQIVQMREDLQQRGPLAPAFWSYWTDRLTSLSLSQLQGIMALGTDAGLEAQVAQVSGAVLPDNTIDAFGDSSADLVYTKVAPCRVADTRVAGGILGTGATRSFYIAGLNLGDFPSQGGTACAIPLGPATAVAMNITVVGASGYGWLRAYPYGGSGNASIINYNTGDTIANGLVMPICDPAVSGCTRDLTVVADSYGGHVLIDVMGYWAKPTKLGKLKTFTVTSGSSSTTSLATTCTNYSGGSISITVPGPGEINVEAKVAMNLSHTNGTSQLAYYGLGTSSTACAFSSSNGGSYISLPSTQPTDIYNIWDIVRTKVTVTAAGTYAYYLNGYMYDGASSSIRFYYSHMTATFHPE